MSEPTCITKAREHCTKFDALNDTSTVFHYDSNGKLWRVSQLLAAYDELTQRAEAAEAKLRDVAYWHEAWKEAEAECEALRKDAAVVAALQEPSTSVLIAMQSADSHGDVTDAQCIEMLRAAVTAAMAVQP